MYGLPHKMELHLPIGSVSRGIIVAGRGREQPLLQAPGSGKPACTTVISDRERFYRLFNSTKQSSCVAATLNGLEAFFSRSHSSASASQYFISFSAAFARSRHIFSKVLKLRPRCSMAASPPLNPLKK